MKEASEFLAGLFGLKGAVALVTGSSAGIGLALARGLAAAGAKVVVNGRTPATVESAAADLRALGAQAFAAPFDVTQAPESPPRSLASRRSSAQSKSLSTTPAFSVARRSKTFRRTPGASSCASTSTACSMSPRP